MGKKVVSWLARNLTAEAILIILGCVFSTVTSAAYNRADLDNVKSQMRDLTPLPAVVATHDKEFQFIQQSINRIDKNIEDIRNIMSKP